jgi:hypothetical protein
VTPCSVAVGYHSREASNLSYTKFRSEILMGGLVNVGVDFIIMIRCSLKKQHVKMCSGLNWPRTGNSGSFCDHCDERSGPVTAENFITIYVTNNCWRNTLYHGISYMHQWYSMKSYRALRFIRFLYWTDVSRTIWCQMSDPWWWWWWWWLRWSSKRRFSTETWRV